MGIYEFKSDDVWEFARFQNAKTKIHGHELQFFDCPYCHGANRGDKYKFSIDLRTGQFNCKRASCNVKGNMITLSRDFDFSLGTETDEYYKPKKKFRTFKKRTEPITPKEPAVAFMEKRGIPKEIVEKYEITTQSNNDNILVFPFFDEHGIMQFVKYRKTDFDKSKDSCKEWCEKGCKPVLFGMKQCNPKNDTLIITEGQIDSLSVATVGFENAVSVPTGANGFTWVPYCYDWVSKFKTIIVFGDYEKEHMTLLNDMARRFPCNIKHVRVEDYKGCKDANELLLKFGKEAVASAIKNSISLPVNRVLSMADVEDVNIYQLKKLKTGINKLDDALYGGIPFGMVCLIAGKRGDGKSTFGSQIIAYALDQGYSTLFYSGELPNYLVKGWLDYQVAGRNHIAEDSNGFGGINRSITKANRQLINNWYRDRAYIYDNSIVENDEKEDLINTIEKAIQRYGVKVILVDNLMTAMYIDEVAGSDKYDQQGRFVRKLTNLALKYECLILLVAHRRKNGFSIDANDEISGSGDITNLAGITLSYDRGSKDEIAKGELTENQRKLIIAKNRLFGKINLNGIILDYDEKSKRIYGDGDNLNYEFGWNVDEDGFSSVGEESELDIPF